jgi:ABC-type multidrug transport system ATPase subunit
MRAGTETDAQPTLLVVHGRRSWRFPPGQRVLIGRDAGCDVVLGDPTVSRLHLCVEYDGGWVIRDLNSAHGSWLDQQRLLIQPIDGPMTVRLASGPVVQFDLDRSGRTQGGQETIRVGRALDNDIVLNDLLVSRHHALLHRSAHGWQLRDLGGHNRTLVNDVPVAGETAVVAGDRLTFGGSEIRLTTGGFMPVRGTRARLVAQDVDYVLPNGDSLLRGVNLDVGPGALVAVTGPPGVGKSALLRVLTGDLRPTAGQVRYDGHDLHDQSAAVRSRIGVVPQHDALPGRRRVRSALASAVRLPAEATAVDRLGLVADVLAELNLTQLADIPIDRLSDDQRARVAIARQLLSSPSLLVLDEPTSGLDPGPARQIMTTLRALADSGRLIILATPRIDDLSFCDTILLLAAGGVPVFLASPTEFPAPLATHDWAEIFRRVLEWPSHAVPSNPDSTGVLPHSRHRGQDTSSGGSEGTSLLRLPDRDV